MKKIIKRIFLAALAALAAYCFLTPMGALRLSVALSLQPVEAVTLTARVITDRPEDTPDNMTLYEITSHIPYEKATEGELVNWQVTRYLIFYIGDYYGDG